jgi:hypothetical protein
LSLLIGRPINSPANCPATLANAHKCFGAAQFVTFHRMRRFIKMFNFSLTWLISLVKLNLCQVSQRLLLRPLEVAATQAYHFLYNGQSIVLSTTPAHKGFGTAQSVTFHSMRRSNKMLNFSLIWLMFSLVKLNSCQVSQRFHLRPPEVAAAAVDAWRCLGWPRVEVVGSEPSQHLLKLASENDIAVNFMTDLSKRNISHFTGSHCLAFLCLTDMTGQLVKQLILENNYPAYQVMIVLCPNGGESWAEFEKWLSLKHLSRGLIKLDLSQKDQKSLSKILALMNYDFLLEMEMDKIGHFCFASYNMQGL